MTDSRRSGLIARVVGDQPDVARLVDEFMFGESRVLVINGEPGSGKSLLLAALANEIDAGQGGFATVGWDVTHEAVFAAFEESIGQRVERPRGQTPLAIRRHIGRVLRATAQFALDFLPETTRLIVEAPGVGERGDTLADELSKARRIVMHSPELRAHVLNLTVRDSPLSARAQAMGEIRRDLVAELDVSEDAGATTEEAIAAFWRRGLHNQYGAVCTWPMADQAALSRLRPDAKRWSESAYPAVLNMFVLELAARSLAASDDVRIALQQWAALPER